MNADARIALRGDLLDFVDSPARSDPHSRAVRFRPDHWLLIDSGRIVGPKAEDICYATSNRQAAVKEIAAQSDLVLVIGAPNSSNSLRLVEVAQRLGTDAKLIQRAAEIDHEWLEEVATLGLTAGASAPESLVREVIDRLGEWRAVEERTLVTAEEKMIFKLPRQLVE